MLKYILRRLLQLIPTLLIITVAVYLLADAAPGTPADAALAVYDDELTPEIEAMVMAQYGLDKPVAERYFIWLGNILRGEMGLSYVTLKPVWGIIQDRVMPTIILSLTIFVISLAIAIPVGIMAAMKPYSIWDNISSFLVMVGTALPPFLGSLALIYIFALKLKVLPSMGMYDRSGGGLIEHLILPVTVVVSHIAGGYIKQTRGSVLEVMNEEYVKAARAKGLSEFEVMTKHVLRNAMIPVVSSVAINIPLLIGGLTVTEKIFAWPGLGSLLVQVINQRDYNVIMGITVVIAVVVLLSNLLVDLLYAYLDPKIRFD